MKSNIIYVVAAIYLLGVNIWGVANILYSRNYHLKNTLKCNHCICCYLFFVIPHIRYTQAYVLHTKYINVGANDMHKNGGLFGPYMLNCISVHMYVHAGARIYTHT